MHKKLFISPEILEKAEKFGIISKDTGAKVRKYAEGGMVQPQAGQPDLIKQAFEMAQEQTARDKMAQDQAAAMGSYGDALQDEQDLANQMAFDAKLMSEDGLRIKYGPQLEKLQARLQSPPMGMKPQDSTFAKASYSTDATATDEIPQVLTTDLEKSQAQQKAQMPQGQSGLMGAYDQMQNAVKLQGDIGAAQAQREAGYLNEMADQQMKYQAKMDERAANFQNIMAEKTAKLDEQVAKVNQMSIDPNRIFTNASTGQKVGMLVSVLLGGLNSSGQNQALSALYKVMESDLNAQKENISLAKDGIAQQRGILADYRKNFETAQEADTAAKIAGLEVLKTKISASAAASNDPMYKARAMEASARIEVDQQKLRTQFEQQAAVTGQIQDQKLARIQQLPENLRGTAMKELQDYGVYNKKLESLQSNAEDIINGKGSEAAISNMAALLKGVVSEKEIKNYLPGTFESRKEKQAKLDKLMDVFNAQYSFPTLQGANIVSGARRHSAPVRNK